MQTPITLRHIASMGTMGESGAIDATSPFYLKETTVGDLEEANRAYDLWMEGPVSKQLSLDQQNEIYDMLWGLVMAREQYAYEAGIRTGFHLARDIFSTPPTLGEIERSVRIAREGAAS